MVYLKIILLKIVRDFALIIWNIVKFFRWNKNINLKNIKKIIINRKDRIWDAIISKPFIILFSKYIKEELKLDIEIHIECSKYNEFIFKEWNYNNYYKLIKFEEEISNSWINIFGMVKQQFKTLFLNKNKNDSKKDTVYIDLIWNPNHINKNKNHSNYYFIGWNLFLNNYLLDYSLTENYVSWVHKNLIQSYIELISQCFKLDDFEKYVNDNIDEMYPDYNYSKNKEWILIFVWCKEYRNLNIKTRESLIKTLCTKYPNKEITIIDDNNNIIYAWLKSVKDFPSNIKLVENNYSLKEMKEYSKAFKTIIGIDWWWFNFIRTCTNSIWIYTIGNHAVRSIFTWRKKHTQTKLWNNRIMNKCEINWKKFWYIYKKSILLPTYDQGIPPKYFKDIKIDL